MITLQDRQQLLSFAESPLREWRLRNRLTVYDVAARLLGNGPRLPGELHDTAATVRALEEGRVGLDELHFTWPWRLPWPVVVSHWRWQRCGARS